MRISVIGLGKLGSPLVAVLASKGFDVVGADINANAVRLLAAGTAPVTEPGLQELLSEAHAEGRVSATTDLAEAVSGTDVTFVVVPTPSDESGGFSLDAVLAAMESIGAALREKSGFHVVALTSTVLPGATQQQVLPVLESASGKTCGLDFGLCYNPEFIALGSVIADMLAPDMILIGESDKRSGDVLTSIYERVCNNEPAVERMTFANAELTKLAVNTFVTTKISYANMLAELCERVAGGDVDVVTRALGRDSRIGSRYLRGAVAYGGPCFPRDNVALAAFARSVGVEATIAEATDIVNRRQVPRLADLLRRFVAHDEVIGILGLSYKPDTVVIEESVGVGLAMQLASEGVTVVVHDPLAGESARALLPEPVRVVDTVEEVVAAASVVVIATPWPEYRGLANVGERAEPLVVVDCWRLLDGLPSSDGVVRVRLGSDTSATIPV